MTMLEPVPTLLFRIHPVPADTPSDEVTAMLRMLARDEGVENPEISRIPPEWKWSQGLRDMGYEAWTWQGYKHAA